MLKYVSNEYLSNILIKFILFLVNINIKVYFLFLIRQNNYVFKILIVFR